MLWFQLFSVLVVIVIITQYDTNGGGMVKHQINNNKIKVLFPHFVHQVLQMA